MKKLLKKLARRILKDEILAMTIPMPEAIVIPPEDFKRYRAQHIINWYEWKNTHLTPDCFIREFKYKVADELLNEIQIKTEELPEGIMYSCDLFMKNN